MTIRQILEAEKEAGEFAEKAHRKQTRRSGEPYIVHPKRVAEIVRKYKSSHKIDELISAALLHDTIEDTETTSKDLKKMFGGLIASLVQQLTSDKTKGKTEYLTKKMLGMTSWGLVIKLADRLDNVSDLKTSPKEWALRYAKQTKQILDQLEKGRKLSGTQKRLVQAIRKKLKELI